ncbi:MAG: TetR family transcriptional regulator [Anaerolineaceae bacterium]|nr:TetR family transcriptional regulator [Anaerolineaceae bacterium]
MKLLDIIPSRRYNVFMKKEDLSLATRMKILDAASKVIVDKGTESFTLDAVAQEAGISKGGLLYHFPSKKQLIQGMIESMIARVDSTLAEELVKSGGDYVAAYIRASFKTKTDPKQISYALFAAIANDFELLKPLRSRFFKMQNEITAASASEEIGTIIRLALDGLWFSDLFDFSPPSLELREKMLDTLLSIAQRN